MRGYHPHHSGKETDIAEIYKGYLDQSPDQQAETANRRLVISIGMNLPEWNLLVNRHCKRNMGVGNGTAD